MNLELRSYLYQTHPEKFTDEEVDKLEWESQMEGIPFQRIKQAEGFNIINTALNVATGFAEGLTTLPVGRWMGVEPKNTVESIANSIGSLMGFIGVVPGPGLLGKVGVSKLFSSMGKSEAARILSEAPLTIGVKSLPMMVADKTMNVIERSGIKAVAEGSKFLNSGTLMGDMAKGALHLGVASAVGAAPIYDISLESLVDERMSGFTSGVIFGAGNRLIGNLFNRGGKLDLTESMTGKTADDILKIAETDKDLAFQLLKTSDKANTIARAFSSSIAFGLPSTLRDDPLELQIYEYLLNGYFGGKELSIPQRKAMEVSMPFQSTGRRALLNPEKYIPDYENLHPEVKRELQIQKELELGGRLNNMSTASAAFLNSTTDAMAEMQRRRDSGEITKKQADDLEFFYSFNSKIADLRQKGEKFDEVSVIEEIAKEQADKGYKEYIDEQEKVFLEKFMSDLTDVQSYAAIEDMSKLGIAASDLDDFYREKKMNYFRPLFKDITTAALQARGATNDMETYIQSYDLEKSLITAMSEYKAESTGRITSEFEDLYQREGKFYSKVEKALDFKIPEEGELRKSLRKAFLNIDSAEARIPLEISPAGNITEPAVYKDDNLKTVIQYAPAPPIASIVSDFRELKEARKVDGSKMPIHEAVALKPEMAVNIIEKLNSQGKFLIGGKKMDSNLFTGKSFFETREEMMQVFEDIKGNDSLGYKGKSFRDEYVKGRDRWTKSGGNPETFDMQFANNLELWRRLNFPNNTMTEALSKIPEGDFVVSPVAFNKRTQLLGAFELRIPTEVMTREYGMEKPRYIILNALNSDGSLHGKFDADYTDKDGQGRDVPSKEHLDGGLYVRQSTYDAMMKATGNDENTGSAKGSHVEINPELGMLIGKYAYHVADTKLNDYLEEKNIDFAYLDTSTKQKGLRKSSDFYTTGGKLDVRDMQVYEGKWDDFSITLTENKFKGKKYETVPAQSGDNIYDTDVQKAMIDTFVTPYVNGTEETNNLFAQYEVELTRNPKRANDIASKIDLDELSLENKLKMLQGSVHSKGKLQKDLLMDIMNLNEDLESFKETYQDGIADKENIEYMESYLKAQGAAAKVLTSGDVTLATTQLPGVKRYFETALKKYLVKSYVTPKSRYIYKSVIRPHAILDFEDNPLRKGHYRLAEGMREKVIEVPEELRAELGKEITLGEAWDKYGHLFKTESTSTELVADEVSKFLEEPFYFQRIQDEDGKLTQIVRRIQPAKGSIVSKVNIEGVDAWVYKDAETNSWTSRIVGQGYHLDFFSTKKRAIENAGIKIRNAKEKGTLESSIEKARKFFDEGLRSGSIQFQDTDGKLTTFKVEKPTPTESVPKAEIPEAVREMFRNPVVRVPMDSPSGLRGLMFDGFVKGQKGTGAFLRPEDMKEIGGADTDIDTVFIMFNNSSSMKKVKDYYVSKKDARRNPKTGGFIDPKDDLETFKSKEEESLYLFDPLSAYKANQMAYEGNQLLGPMLSMAKKLKVFLKFHEGTDKVSGYNPKGEEIWTAKIRPDGREKLETLTSSVVNFAADSADGIKLLPREQIKKLFLDKIFSDIYAKDGQTWRKVTVDEKTSFVNEFGKTIEYDFFRLHKNPTYARLQTMDNIFTDRNWDRKINGQPQKYSLDEMGILLREATEGKPLPGYRYEALSMLAKQNLQGSIAWRAADVDADKLMKLFDKAFMSQRVPGKKNEYIRTDYADMLYEAAGVQLHLNANEKARKKSLKTWEKDHEVLKSGKPEMWAAKRTEFINDMYRNDLRYAADAIFIMEKYKKLTETFRADKKDAVAIKNFVAGFKGLYNDNRDARQAKESLFNHLYLDENGKVRYDPSKFHLVNKEVFDKLGEEYYNSVMTIDPLVKEKLHIQNRHDLTPQEKEYFESLMLSSFTPHHHGIDYSVMVEPSNRKFYAAKEAFSKKFAVDLKAVERMLDSFTPEAPADIKFGNNVIPKEELAILHDLRKIYKDAVGEFYSQNKDSQWFDKPFISGKTVNEYTKVFNHVVDYTGKDLTPYTPVRNLEEENRIFKSMNNERVNLEAETKKIPLYTDEFARDLVSFKPVDIKNYEKMQKVSDDFKQVMIDNPHWIPYVGDMFIKFSENVYGVDRSFKDMTFEEFKNFTETMKDLAANDLKDIPLEKRHYFFLPQSLNNLHATKDIIPTMLKRPVFNSEKNIFVEQNVMFPMSRMEILNESAHTILRNREEAIALAEKTFSDNALVKFLNVLSNSNKDINSTLLMEYVVQQRMKRQFKADEEYAIKNGLDHDFTKVFKEIEDTERRMKESGMLDRDWNIMTQGEGGGKSEIFKTEKIIKDMDELITDLFDKVWKQDVLKEFTRRDGKKSSELLFINPYTFGDAKHEDAIQHHFGVGTKDRPEAYTAKTLAAVSGENYIKNPNWIDINGIIDGLTNRLLNKNAINNTGINLKDYMQHQYAIENREYYMSYRRDGVDLIETIRPSDSKTFKDKVRVLNTLWNYKVVKDKIDENGDRVYDEDGNVEKMDYYPHRETMRFREPLTDFLKDWKGNYFPKTMHPKSQIEERMRKTFEDPNMPDDMKVMNMTKYARMFGADDIDLGNVNEAMMDLYDNGFGTGKVHSGKVSRTPNLMSRDRLHPLSGYATSPKVILNYLKRLYQEYYDGVGMLSMMRQVDLFREQNKGKDTAKYWEGFMRNRIRTTFGYPSNFSSQWAEDPNAKVKGNLYHLVTEDYWANRSKILDGFFGITPEMRKTYSKKTEVMPEDFLKDFVKKEKLPAGIIDVYQTHKKVRVLQSQKDYDAVEMTKLRQEYKSKIKKLKGNTFTDKQIFDMLNKVDTAVSKLPEDVRYSISDEQQDVYKPLRESLVARKLSSLSNMEGKVSMMALLFHPKSALVNLLTSYQNTISSTGFDYFKRAGKLEVVGSMMNKKSWSEIEDAIDNLGGIESQYRYEVDLSQSFKSENSKRFFERAVEAIKTKRDTSDATLFEIAKQEGLTEAFVNKSAYFMKLTERMGRKKAWLAHYLKGAEILSATKYSYDWDDPWLVQFANRGVSATQFLYHNAARPEFARTSLGKIFTRFQTFAMNSINFRRELLVRGHRSGWVGENKEKFERLLTADLFVLAMASALPFSLFNSVVSPPINYLSELAKYLFGDEEQRKMAFFGALPYPFNIAQPILAPSTRYFTSVLNMFLSGDTERFFDYNLWTWFPFGRIANDVRKTLTNPRTAPERMLGLPFNTLIDKMRESSTPPSE